VAKRQKQTTEIKSYLEELVDKYNRTAFIEPDPISIPHLFKKKQDIEIAGFFAAVLAWGQRPTILKKSKELMQLMDNAPHDFIVNHTEADLKSLTTFKHRTFNATDTLYFVEFLHHHYVKHDSLESAFRCSEKDVNVENALNSFQETFFSLPDAPKRTQKHIPSPKKNSTCKRLAMYLRWMVRTDNNGVDFGLWKEIKMHQLVCPVDLHVDRIARRLHLITRKSTDWLTTIELTEKLKTFDPKDPSKYDFALFGLGVDERSSKV
jgi:uncharacterized protein (TIGR02757 family)